MAQISRDLRNENRVRLLELIQSSGVISRAELSRQSGISGPTVMRVIDEFLELGIVCETELAEKSVGRRPVGLSLFPDFNYTVSILHEGNWIQAGLLDMSGRLCAQSTVAAEKSIEDFLRAQIPEMIDDLLKRQGVGPEKISGVGIGIPAMLNSYENILYEAPLIGVDREMNISDWLGELGARYGASVWIENDVNAMALGEHLTRRLEDRADMAYVALGTGVGSGMILRGELRRGKNNMAGEIGYLLTGDGTETLEARIGRSGLEQRFGWRLDETLTEAQRAALVEDLTKVLSCPLINYAIAVDLDLIVLGGRTTALLGDALVDAVRTEAERRSPISFSVEGSVSPIPGIEGLGHLMRSRFSQKLERNGLEALKHS